MTAENVPDSPRVIGIAGPSCSGKSGLARELRSRLEGRNPAIFPLDAYYRDLSHLPPAEADRRNFDHPDALEWPLIETHFDALLRGEAVEHPVYDFANHVRKSRGVRVGPAGLVIVEGLFALLHEPLRSRYDLAVYLDIGADAAFDRRLARDERERGIARAYVENQWRETVLPMAERHVIPTRVHADLVLDATAPAERSAFAVLQALGPAR